MSIGTYSPTNNSVWLIVLSAIATFAIFFSLGGWIKEKIENNSDQNKRLMQTAIKIESDKEFAYAIETRQGNILAIGLFESVDTVKFDEMNKSFIAVERIKQRYTRHEETYECGTTERPRTCTRVYYEWDYAGSEKKEANEVRYKTLTFDANSFNYNLRDINAGDIIEGGKGKYLYLNSTWWHNEGDIRYYYKVVNNMFNGTILANTSNGKLENIGNGKINISDKTPTQMVKDATKKATFVKWLFISVWGLLTIGCTYGVAMAVDEYL